MSYSKPIYNTLEAKEFIKNNLSSLSLISTYTIGRKVYNLRDLESNKVVGFLAYLVNYNKLPSLVNYIYNRSKYIF